MVTTRNVPQSRLLLARVEHRDKYEAETRGTLQESLDLDQHPETKRTHIKGGRDER